VLLFAEQLAIVIALQSVKASLRITRRLNPPRLALLFSVVIVAYDAFTALIARAIGATCNSFLVLAFALFFVAGVYAGRKPRSWAGARAADRRGGRGEPPTQSCAG
jgi:hypothetical protein